VSYLAIVKKAEEELRSNNKPSPIPQDNLISIRAWEVDRVHGEDGRLLAVKICSAVLEAHLWVVWDRSYQPMDNLAIFFGEEMPLLKGKSLEDLKLIHRTKLIFPGAKVIQEGPG